MDDPFKDLPRLSDEALGPCMACGKVMLGTDSPIFYRITVENCGIDKAVIDKHVGLAMMLGGGSNGLALAGVMGTGEKPVIVMASGSTNLCNDCSSGDINFLHLLATALELS